MKASIQDRMEGKIREVKGAAKEKIGRATRELNLEDQGAAEKLSGKSQRKIGEIKKVFEI